MQNNDQNKDIDKVIKKLRLEGDKLVKDFESKMEEYQQQLTAELSKTPVENSTDKDGE